MKKILALLVLTFGVFLAQTVYAANLSWNSVPGGFQSTAPSNIAIGATETFPSAQGAATLNFVFNLASNTLIKSIVSETEDGQIDIASVTLLANNLSYVFASANSIGTWKLANTFLAAGTYTVAVVLNSAAQASQLNVQVTALATPIPAAVWLFGSALVGLVGASRRKAGLAV